MTLYKLAAVMFLITVGAHYDLLRAQTGEVEIKPDLSFSVSDNFPEETGLKLREMRAGDSGLWMLMQAQPGNFLIVRTTPSGNVQKVIRLPEGARASGLAAVKVGVATVLYKGKKATLSQYGFDGRALAEIPLGCFSAEALVSLEGGAGIICPDGTIANHSEMGQIGVYHSWARPGSLVESLSGKRLAIIDQVTGQILLNDLTAGTISAVTPKAPELIQAVKKNEAISKNLGPARLGKQITVMGAAADAGGIYLLVWPYQPREGPSVIRLSADGQAVARYRCRTPGGEQLSLHKIAVDRGFLFLGPVAGPVFRYKLE